MNKQRLALRKKAMEKRMDWGFRGLNPQPIDRAGQAVSLAWHQVVEKTDGGTDKQLEDAVRAAEAAEESFAQQWN